MVVVKKCVHIHVAVDAVTIVIRLVLAVVKAVAKRLVQAHVLVLALGQLKEIVVHVRENV